MAGAEAAGRGRRATAPPAKAHDIRDDGADRAAADLSGELRRRGEAGETSVAVVSALGGWSDGVLMEQTPPQPTHQDSD